MTSEPTKRGEPLDGRRRAVQAIIDLIDRRQWLRLRTPWMDGTGQRAGQTTEERDGAST